ncbi:hypothetical protein D8X55_03235 [Malacoplasma penetrans]|uniref:Integral membrane protein n=1 Tax=Malacoplasma penetrans (strain HF-2) TaxID=272633 RepID=Q8EW59_MALP2|nr:integral membrane protein [Malacoplasma penetrans]RXY96635.1 hypothetical protein D8X55_03235 [Malacoplasma penetrans]BAC44137.1 putative integral membrane protein [Malacoplasma penetrans HF-2]
MHSWILITAVVLFFISSVFLGGIIFVYVKNYKCKQKENWLKKEVNELLEYNFEKINIPIDHISFSSQKPEFESVQEFFNKFAYRFNEKVNDIKNAIYLIPKMLTNYDWKSFSILYDEISYEILIQKKSLASVFELHQNLLKYRDYISYILVSYRENGWDLINFFNKNLSDKNDKIKEVRTRIKDFKKCTVELNDCIENYDINNFLKALDNINNSLIKLVKVINENYIMRKQNNYINYSINEIKNIINKNHQNIKSSIVNHSQKEITRVENNRNYLNSNINNLSDNDIEKITTSLIKSLSKVKKVLNITFKSNEFFNQNKSDIDKAFQNMIKLVPLILKTFDKIFTNFSEDREIKDLIIKSNYSFSNILSKLNNYFATSNKNNYNPGELLESAKQIIEEIIEALSLADKIVLDVDKKYDYSKKILNDITANKLILTQMKAFIIENNINVENHIILIDKLNRELDNIENKFFNEKSNNLEYNFALLSETKGEISALEMNLSRQELMKAYIEKMINYSCLQMVQDESIKYKLAKPIQMYNEGKYKESANLLLSQMKK